MADEDVQIVKKTLKRNRGYFSEEDTHGAKAKAEASASQGIAWHGLDAQMGTRMPFTHGWSKRLVLRS